MVNETARLTNGELGFWERARGKGGREEGPKVRITPYSQLTMWRIELAPITSRSIVDRHASSVDRRASILRRACKTVRMYLIGQGVGNMS